MNYSLAMNKRILHVYGKTCMVSEFCEKCGTDSFIKDGQFSCCGAPCKDKREPDSVVFEVDSGNCKRKRPPQAQCDEILKMQNYRCYYCGAIFGTFRLHKKQLRIVDIQFDHLIPFSYSRENDVFVAACGVCNRHKSNKIFDSLVEAQKYLMLKVSEGAEATCEYCGEPFIKTRPWKKFCNSKCQWNSWNIDHPRAGVKSFNEPQR